MIFRDRGSLKGRLGAIRFALWLILVSLLPIATAHAQTVPATCPASLGTANLIDHNANPNISFCEACGVGTVRIEIVNPFTPGGSNIDFANLVITEDLLASGLTYVPGSTNFTGTNIAVPGDFEPMIVGTTLRWDLSGTGFVMNARPGGSGNRARLFLEFDVEWNDPLTSENLWSATREIDASLDLEPSCAPGETYSTSTGSDVLAFHEPVPVITKLGRNVDAGQGAGSYSDPVYGHVGDDVIWRVEVRNAGNAPLQDLVFTDSITPGNFDIQYVCDNEGEANTLANTGAPGSCINLGSTTSVVGLDVAATFGGGANPYIVAPPGGSGFYFFVGRINDSCSNEINTVSDVEWGCQQDTPVGGIAATTNNVTAGDDAELSTLALPAGVDIDVALTGINPAQPMGATGFVTITISNNSGGTIKGAPAGLLLQSLLPTEYVVDPTYTPTIATTPAYGATYPGMINTLTWLNPAAPAAPLTNTDLDFQLTSSVAHPEFPAANRNMIRHGDVVTIQYRTVLIDPTYYDYVANLDVRTEEPGSDPANTDPTETFPISSRAEIDFTEFCTGTNHNLFVVENDTAEPEDLDIDVTGSELVFILTNTGDPLPLTVALRNRGGHDADDYFAYVTFGEAMTVQTVPPGCIVSANPPTQPVWTQPVALPATASVYVCDRGVINPGETELLNFEVVKNTAASFDDDLTFRADVIGEITLSDGTLLDFPTPTPRADTILPRANDYSIDAIWARVIGYNLFKDQVGLCSENQALANTPDDEIEIGEECNFHVESGGWFGFETPGFTYIAVQNIEVRDLNPNGQGFISSTDPTPTSTAAIEGISFLPPPAALDEAEFYWTFNTDPLTQRITEKDHWFRVDFRTRLLNDPIDTRTPPNEHAEISSNILTSTFEGIFLNQSTGLEELYNLGPNTVGFPREVHRRVDLTVTEPNLTVTKTVCNETRWGLGASCSMFLPAVDDGDAFDTYVYRIRVANELESDAVQRAPAYDVTVTSVTDISDQLYVDLLTGDNIDNDGDGLTDGADGDGEGTITDNLLVNGTPAQVIASYTHSTALRRIDPDQYVDLYYRVDPDDNVAPMQILRATATAAYDSLDGPSGAQTDPPLGANGEIGGARQYVSAPDEATIEIIPVEVSPKQILRVSNSTLGLPVNPQPVSIGEEVEFQLEALIPVARLRNFMVVDELPAGLSCADAPIVNLNSDGPHAAAEFDPGGQFIPTCTDTEVIWNFGDQTVTMSDRVDRRFEFEIQFIARVDNIAANQDGVVIRNGGTSTVTEVRYVDEGGASIALEIGEAAVVVQEPLLALTKTFSVAEVDASDLPRVTVTATNNGTATAYNPRFLDDLRLAPFAYRGDIQGVNPPTDDVVTLDADAPIFSWPPGFAIVPGDSISFSFAVEVDPDVEPEQVLPNTIQSDWTSLPGQTTALNSSGTIGPDGSATGMRIGAIPNAVDPLNDYQATAIASVPVAAVAVDKIDLVPTQNPEVGAHKSFQIDVLLPEGVTQDVIVSDALDTGAVSYVLANNASYDITYEFLGITDINGAPPSEAAFTTIPADQTSGTATWTIGTVTTASEDDLAVQAIAPTIRIRYFARIDNDLATNVGSTLQNTATVYSIHGETGLQTSVSDATGAVTVIESALTATKVLTNVTPGKLDTDPPAFNDILQYVVRIVNGGNATAYDVNVVDTLPPELGLYNGFAPTARIDAALVPGFVAIPAGAPLGPLVWGRQNGDDSLDIPPGSFLELTYQVEVRGPPADGSTISNNVYTDWTSLDVDPGSLYERTGVGCPTITAPNDYCYGPAVAIGTVDAAPPSSPVVKQITQPTASIGEIFRYTITVPETPYAFPAYDVRIYDDFADSAADLRFVSVSKISGLPSWTPINTGTPTSLVIEDPTNGIDIPAGEQVVLEIAVVLEDTGTNVHGLPFTNTANYVYNWLDGNLTTQRMGAQGISPPMTIVGPEDVTVEKDGPGTMTLGAPATFTVDVHNIGDGPAWNLTIFDQLPNLATAGTCDQPPSAFTAQIFQADRITPVTGLLVEGVDYSVASRGEPDCDFTISMLTPAATVGADQRLIITYQTVLDDDSQDGESITNVVGATRWYSADGSIPATAGDRREYTRIVVDGSIGSLDHEDAYTTNVALPIYTFEKTVVNLTTGQDPAVLATPGDLLQYTIRLVNLRDAPIDDLTILDELDRLNVPPAFAPQSLQLISVPATADATNTSDTGGAAGTGVVDVRGLSLAGLNDSLEVVFNVALAPVLANGSTIENQSQLSTNGVLFALSDDPNVNGPADPLVPNDEDPTRLQIVSAPVFQVEKTSTYLTGDPTVLLAGETLRYAITVKNVGTDDATDATIRDAIPVNTTYVAGSTSLNGLPVPDGAGNTPPLASGLLLSAPEDATPGAMRADATATTSNVATLAFDVVVGANVADGTVISNQAFVSAVAGGVSDQPSDDPRTVLPDDPTRDVVGNAPLLFAPKQAMLVGDVNGNGQVDAGDRLHYTITVYNNGAVPATGATIMDAVPANTTWFADSLRLNTLPVGVPDGGVSPLASGIPIASSDQPAPPPPGGGVLTPGETAIIEFDLVVNAGVPGGTVISNQAIVRTIELPNLLTDGDGNPSTGPEPTLVLVGNGQQLAITKTVTVVGGGAALPGSLLEYTVAVTNIATVAADTVVILDDLTPLAGQLTLVPGSATLNGALTGVTELGSLVRADYGAAFGPLAPSATIVLRFRATLAAGLANGMTVTNTGVVTWNTPTQTANASVSISIGGMPGVGALNGSVWHDANFDRLQGVSERAMQGWIVDLYRNGQPVQSATTDTNGDYQIIGIAPNVASGDSYEIRFRAPDAGPNTGSLGRAESAYTNGLQSISALTITAGSNQQDLNLPIDPQGVVYEAVLRIPVSGATLSLLEAGSQTAVSASCFDDPTQQGQVTGSNGYYKFDLNFGGAGCPDPGDYLIAVVPPGPDFTAGVSQIIPPLTDAATAPFDVPACPGGGPDAIPVTGQFCEIQPSEFAPPTSVAARSAGTDYHLHITLDGTASPGTSQAFNNHIPLDPVLGGAVALSKTTPSVNVSRGDLVPYTITFNNTLPVALADLSIADRYPGGFRYVEGSARVDGVALEPAQNGNELVWEDVGVAPLSTRTIVLLLAVGAGVTEGEFVNRAQAFSSVTGLAYSGEAAATVRVVPDPTFDCTDVLGKVFDDTNRNGDQDQGEVGLAGIRLVTVRGLAVTTDPYGRFHITCAIVPNEERGSNFVLKLDDRTLPSGYRMSTRQTQVKRATRGKALEFNFGATIGHVVGLDMADAVFEPGGIEIRTQWKSRLDLLLDELEKQDAILRLSYIGDVEDPGLVKRRLEAVKREITDAWKARGGSPLTIETEIFWRRGAPPVNRPRPTRSDPPETPKTPETSALESALPHVGAGPPGLEPGLGRSTERHLSTDETFTQWSVDPERLATEIGDTLEEREVVGETVEIVKLTDVMPPIYFESGVADVSPEYIARLRQVLDDMKGLRNVRLHLVGHADDQALSPALARLYDDNEGLSRERAGEVAEFLQSALQLPSESISFAWTGADEPIAPNSTPAGRARNRRVEVEVWYDEVAEKTTIEDIVVSQDIKRVKVCRTETVCKLRYREGHERRVRVKNLIPPLNYQEEISSVPKDFIRQVQEALFNLRDKQNVTVKFIAYTDDVPLTGRAERIYGNALAISKARAHRVALEIKDALDLPTAAIASDGRGDSQPVASNATPRGRALNRRVEVEFWHDDPLLELPEELQICPDPGDAELVTRVYDPPWGQFTEVSIVDGEAMIPSDLGEQLTRAMTDLEAEQNVRVRFVGYTHNERLTRRMADVYGDDIGLSAARARRTMERIQTELELSDDQVEHEGRGYVQSEDVVNGGFVQDGSDHVVVQVVYDEPAVIDDYEGIEVTPITRELHASDPLSLNLMRITVDGKPIDDPGRSSADIQRCTDVALDAADIQFRFDDLESDRRLSITSSPAAVRPGSNEPVRFQMYTNYPHFIERAEVRVFDMEQSLQSEPLAVLPIDRRGRTEWQPAAQEVGAPLRPLSFVLRAYGEDGLFDETEPQSLWMVPDEKAKAATQRPTDAEVDTSIDLEAFATADADLAANDQVSGTADPERVDLDIEETVTTQPDRASAGATATGDAAFASDDALLAGYGESEGVKSNIVLSGTGTVRVKGAGIPPGHTVWLAGTQIPVNEKGEFVGEVLLPTGMNTVEVAVLDSEGNGELFLRDLEIKKSDWFFVGMADLTLSADLSGGAPSELGGNNSTRLDSWADGRLAFFTQGKWGKDWKLTASADTREGPVEDLFTNFLDKSPDALFRRIDPDYYYPTFGDDSTIDEYAPTLGKFYVKLSQGENHLLWGNFNIRYDDNELALVDRGLYGANARYQSVATTRFGERRVVVDGFAADPGTVPSREQFRGTGGSLYFLQRQDLLIGSDRVSIEVKDKASGIVTQVIRLQRELDYDIDYLQGRILLTEPLSTVADDRLLIRDDGLSGNEVYLVVRYEYTPGFESIDTLNAGGEAHVWLNDFVKLGATASRSEEGDIDSTLFGADLTVRKNTQSWIKLQAGRSDGLVSNTLFSEDGGFTFTDPDALGSEGQDAYAYRIDASLGLDDLFGGARGTVSVYGQRLEEGYSAPGLNTQTDTDQYGGIVQMPVVDSVNVIAKADRSVQDEGLETLAVEVDVDYAFLDGWNLEVGARHDQRDDNSPVVVATQQEGDRTDAIVQVGFDPEARWNAYIFGQATVQSTGDRDENNRGGVGGGFRVTDKIAVDGEVSDGDQGLAAQIGTTYQRTERSKFYLNYALENERGYDGLSERRGNLILGARARLTDSTSVYAENQYQHATVSGLTRTMGVDYTPTERWQVSVNWEDGNTHDQQTNAETARRAGGVSVGYRFEDLNASSGVEYIYSNIQQSNGTRSNRATWLFRNNLQYQMNPDWRLLAKFNFAISDSSEGNFFDGGFTEAVIGYAYRPVLYDRFNALVKYTYFYNVPTVDQVGQDGTPSQFIQKSHIAAIDVGYDITRNWSIGAKYAYRLSQVSIERDNPDFFDNNAHLYILRTDYRFLKNWEGLVEGRMLDLPDIDQRRAGSLVALYRYFGEHLKVGLGYNFTDFSEDLTDLSYDHHGVFFNMIGTF